MTHPIIYRITSLIAACLLGLAACSERPQPEPEAAAVQETTGPAYRPVTNIQETMAWVVDPLVDVIWASAGTIITAEGSTELAPTTDEGWAKVTHAAIMLAESGNLLMIPGRSMGADWDEYALGLMSASELAIKASRDQDSDALFAAGGRIYQVCTACHSQYWVTEDE